MCFLGVLIVVGVGLLLFGGIEAGMNVFQNLAMTGHITIPQIWIFVGLGFLLANWVIVFSMIGKIANFLVIKDYTKRKTSNPAILYFQESWYFFWRYVMVGVRTLFYVIWPILLIIILGGILGTLLFHLDGIAGKITSIFILIILFGLYVYFVMKRSINVLFAQSLLIANDKTSKESFENSLSLIKGNWWVVFASFFSFMLLIAILPAVVFAVASELFSTADPLIIDAISQLYSFVVVAPAGVAFTYFLMLHVAKKKHLK